MLEITSISRDFASTGVTSTPPVKKLEGRMVSRRRRLLTALDPPPQESMTLLHKSIGTLQFFAALHCRELAQHRSFSFLH